MSKEENQYDDDKFNSLLDQFIQNELSSVSTEETVAEPAKEEKPQEKNYVQQEQTPQKDTAETKENIISASYNEEEYAQEQQLAEEERALWSAYKNFVNSCNDIQPSKEGFDKFKLQVSQLLPRFKPFLSEILLTDTLTGWDIAIQAFPQEIDKVPLNSSDEELLNLAERLTDVNLQSMIISYVETLIELEACELAYEKRRLIAKQKYIEQQIVSDYFKRKEKIAQYIKMIEKQKFPINAEKLINNYAKIAMKDPIGAHQTLCTNPAVFSPILIDKIPPKLFGLIKITPEDGIIWNKKIANFIKKMKIRI